MAANGKGIVLRYLLNHKGDEGWPICRERGMLRAPARGARWNSGDSLILQELEHEQQMHRKKSIQVGAKRGIETLSEKVKKKKEKETIKRM